MEELLCKLESLDTEESRKSVTRLQSMLRAERNPVFLGELVEFYFATRSKRAVKVLTSLREAYSQDFFDKLNECIHKPTTRLPVLRLLASILNSQASWLYRVVDHPLFASILHYLKTSGSVVVLTSALLVVCATLPLVPSYISRHLSDLFEIFAQLATIKSSARLGLTPPELYLHLDVAVYYFFLQLYALFPCALTTYLRGRYGPTGEVNEFQQYIAPFFHHVQLHPSLITDASGYETSKAKWGAMEPHDIATLSLSMCLDPVIAVQGEEAGWVSSHPPPSHQLNTNSVHEPRNTTAATSHSFRSVLGPEAPQWRSTPNPCGLKSAQELTEFWSPSVVFGQITPSDVSREPSRSSRPISLHTSNFSSPLSGSAVSSAQHTPGPTGNVGAFTFKNYSPTASVDGESLQNRQPPSISHSAIHTPSLLEESVGSTPLSQSLRTDSAHLSASSTRAGSPIKMVTSSSSREPLNQSLKTRFGRFIDLFSPRKKARALDNQSRDSEDFTEIFTSDAEHTHQLRGTEIRGESLQQYKMEEEKEGVEEEEEEEEEEGEEEKGEEEEEEELELPLEGKNHEFQEDCKGDDAATPCVEKFDLTLGVHRDLRRFSHIGAVRHGDELDTREGPYSSSFPGRSPSGRLKDRKRTSYSETCTAQTVLQLQERLQRLVESTETIADTEPGSMAATAAAAEEEEEEEEEESEEEESEEVLPQHRPTLCTLASTTDSTVTLLGSSPRLGGRGGEGGKASRLLTRRVSVCSRRQPEGSHAAESESPVALLDQFVLRGEMLHRGRAEDILLTELEDVDWSHFGSCPHSEELGVMHCQVALLHGQLLFERHQCLQHARRNRRLLSRARTTTQVTEQLLSLHGQVHQQNRIIRSLQEELRQSFSRQRPSHAEEKLRSENSALHAENSCLREDNLRLTAEVRRVTQRNSELSQELERTGERLFALEREKEHLQPQLTRARQLQTEVDLLLREIQVLGEIYHTQREQTLALLCQGRREREERAQWEAIQREKEAAERSVSLLRQELECVHESVLEQQTLVVQREEEIAALHQMLERTQGKCQEKLTAIEDKYRSLQVSTQQLEAVVMELRGRAPLKKRAHLQKHRRSSSHPTVTTSPESPHYSSPSSYHPSPSSPHPSPLPHYGTGLQT